MNFLLANRSNRKLAYPTATVRVTSMWGAGVLVYVTDDGYAGVRLDGEKSVHEYPAKQIFRAE